MTTEVLEKRRPRLVSCCHHKSVAVPIEPVYATREIFPSAVEGFEDVCIARSIHFYGGEYDLLDVSGLTRREFFEVTLADRYRKHAQLNLKPSDLFQCLEWLHEEKLEYSRIVVYIGADVPPLVAELCEGGFRRAVYEGDDAPWGEGTFCLIYNPEI